MSFFTQISKLEMELGFPSYAEVVKAIKENKGSEIDAQNLKRDAYRISKDMNKAIEKVKKENNVS